MNWIKGMLWAPIHWMAVLMGYILQCIHIVADGVSAVLCSLFALLLEITKSKLFLYSCGMLSFWYLCKKCPWVAEYVRRFIILVCKIVLKIFGLSIVEESVCLTVGQHELVIDVGPKSPINVWVSLEDQYGTPVCQGNIDKVGVQMGDQSFILYADVYSSSRVVRWIAVLN